MSKPIYVEIDNDSAIRFIRFHFIEQNVGVQFDEYSTVTQQQTRILLESTKVQSNKQFHCQLLPHNSLFFQLGKTKLEPVERILNYVSAKATVRLQIVESEHE